MRIQLRIESFQAFATPLVQIGYGGHDTQATILMMHEVQ